MENETINREGKSDKLAISVLGVLVLVAIAAIVLLVVNLLPSNSDEDRLPPVTGLPPVVDTSNERIVPLKPSSEPNHPMPLAYSSFVLEGGDYEEYRANPQALYEPHRFSDKIKNAQVHTPASDKVRITDIEFDHEERTITVRFTYGIGPDGPAPKPVPVPEPPSEKKGHEDPLPPKPANPSMGKSVHDDPPPSGVVPDKPNKP